MLKGKVKLHPIRYFFGPKKIAGLNHHNFWFRNSCGLRFWEVSGLDLNFGNLMWILRNLTWICWILVSFEFISCFFWPKSSKYSESEHFRSVKCNWNNMLQNVFWDAQSIPLSFHWFSYSFALRFTTGILKSVIEIKCSAEHWAAVWPWPLNRYGQRQNDFPRSSYNFVGWCQKV